MQQSASKQVVEGLRRQLKEMKAAHIEKDKELSSLQARNGELLRQLGEARAEILDLRDERDALLDTGAGISRASAGERNRQTNRTTGVGRITRGWTPRAAGARRAR